MANEVRIDAKGPLFQGQPGEIVRQEAQGMVTQLTEMGEERLSQMLRPRPAGVFLSVAEAKKGQASKGHLRSNLNSVVEGLHGIITDGGVIYGAWIEGTSSRNQTTRFKGYGAFRRTAQWLQSQVPRVARERAQRLVQRLGGN